MDKVNIKDVTEVTSGMLQRAESRLALNVKNSQDTFSLFAGVEMGLIYFTFTVTKESSSFFWSIIYGLVIMSAGMALHVAAWRSYTSYKIKVKADEAIIEHYESVLNDPQHVFEEQYPKPKFASAGKARVMLLWILFGTTMVLGFTVLIKAFYF